MHKPTLQLTALRDDNAVLNSTKGRFWFVAVLLTLALASQYNGRETRMYHTRKYIEEHEATIEIQDSDMGLTFFSGSSPPRIQKIDLFSYFIGWLFVGDWIVQIDKRAIKSAEDFTAATQHSGAQPKSLLIRFRRDDYFRMATIKVAEVKRKLNCISVFMQVRWREDLPVGIVVERKGANIVVASVESGSIAAQNIFPGDVLVDVNGREVNNDVSAAKKAIRQSIIEKKNVVLKLERDITPLKMISTPAVDVLAILKRQRGFWKRRSKFEPIEEEGPGKPKRVYHVPNVESEPLPVDDTGKKLVATPSRDGGMRTEEPVETAEEEPATEEEEF
uniref:PDZ domain-containing protein n=3 Tax=Meloidogyne TaxID=189290 RepID=A0A914NCI1_MELIC